MGNPLKNFIQDNLKNSEIVSTINNSDLLKPEIISKSKKVGLNILNINDIS